MGQGPLAMILTGRPQAEGLVPGVLLTGGAENGLAAGFSQGPHVPDEDVAARSRLLVAEPDGLMVPPDVALNGFGLDHGPLRVDWL